MHAREMEFGKAEMPLEMFEKWPFQTEREKEREERRNNECSESDRK